MKKLAFLLLGVTLFLSSCAYHDGLTSNRNNHTTEVVLSSNNYRVVEAVRGEAEVMYVLGFGGLAKQALIAEAKAEMLKKANIVGGSKAIINETVELKYTFFPLIRKMKVVVSGHVIEFTGQ